jgi:hypothetical protein
MTNTYTIDYSCIKVSGGRYKSKSPTGAAKKAATRLFKKAQTMPKYKNLKKLTFCIRETTQGSSNNMYDYSAERIKLAKPLVREINGVEIINRYKTIVKSLKPKAHKSKTSCQYKKRDTKGGDCGCNK